MTTKNAADMTDEELEQAENASTGEPPEQSTESTETTDTATTGATTEQQELTTTETTEQTAQTGETTDTTTDTTAAAQTSAGAETGKVAGVASKDGTRVLPYSALQAERRSARQASARADRAEKEAERLKGEIEDLRAGKSKDTGQVTEEEVQRMEADFPEVGAKMRAVFERNQELAKQVAAAKPKEDPNDDVADDPVQEIIDQVPLLVEWQHDTKHADKWQRAIDIDNVMRTSPKWKDKPALDRFAHVAGMVAEEFDIEVPGKGTARKPRPSNPQPRQRPTRKLWSTVPSASPPARSAI
jgi:hypothetical protein